MVTISENKINEILSRGVSEFIDPDDAFRQKLLKKTQGEYTKDIIIKLGVDPTRPDIHLGHAVILHKMRALQDLGCKVVFLVGDFTASIGDPSGKDKTRPEVNQEEVEKNMETYLDQIKKILRTDEEVFSWIRNSDWFTSPFDITLPKDYKITLTVQKGSETIDVPINPQSIEGRALAFDESRMQKKALQKKNITSVSVVNLLWTLKHITHGRLIQRDMFQERIKKGSELSMSEMLYPVFQGIDSHILYKIYGSCDLEIGGTDQTFNMLVGRDVMHANNEEPQAVMSMEILTGTGGREKMSKSLDNYIAITDAPEDMYGKVMSIPDELMVEYFELCTFTPNEEIEEIEKSLMGKNKNPRDTKMRLAREIVALYHGEKEAERAQENFIAVFQKKITPETPIEISISKGDTLLDIVERLKEKNLIASKTELQRLARAGGIYVDGERITSLARPFSATATLKLGKTRFVRLII
ncbi:MAG: tyrosine--tRNA ligase [Candidatus Paceibacterota bacterium]